MAQHSGSEEIVVPLAEEKARIEKRSTSERIRIRTITDAREELIAQELVRHDVETEHVPVNRYLAADEAVPQIRQQGEVTIIPVFEEVLVVEKRLLLKEEIHIRQRVSAELTQIPVTLRSQRAVTERLNGEGENLTDPTAR